MGNFIVIGILVVIVILALSPTIKHFKGQGSCCGGGSSEIKENKKLTEPKLGEKMIEIEGMHCDHCKNSVEHAINKIDGAACKVNLKKKTATVAYSETIQNDRLKEAIESLGFEVKSISEK